MSNRPVSRVQLETLMASNAPRMRSAFRVALSILAVTIACQDSPTNPLGPPQQGSMSFAADSAGEYYYHQGFKVYLDTWSSPGFVDA